MRRGARLCLLGALALLCLLEPAPVLAGGGATVGVSATVLTRSNCRFNNPRSAVLDFGVINPGNSGNVTAVPGSLTIRCGGSAADVVYALTHDSGLHETGTDANRMKHATLNEYLPYSITFSPSSGTMQRNQDQVIAVGGTITPAAYQNAFLGTYADTVTVTVVP